MLNLATIGTQINGKPAQLRADIAVHIPIIFEYVLKKTKVNLINRIIQAYGFAEASANVHSDGAAIDFRVWALTRADIESVVMALRECGFAATWFRDWEGNQHIHAGANLGDINTAVQYQVVEVITKRTDGTAKHRPDPHKAPTQWRTIQQGSQWALTQLAKDKEMAINATDIANAIMAYEITANGKKQAFAQHLATLFVQTQAQSVAVGAEVTRDAANRDAILKLLNDINTKVTPA